MRKEFFDILLKLEGVYSNNPKDPGKETIFGIASRYHPETFAKVYTAMYVDKDAEKAREIAREFYENIFKNLNADKIASEKIQYCYFDSAVNCGKRTAVRQLQYAINFINSENPEIEQLKCDGIFGPKTMKALEEANKIISEDKEKENKMYHHLIASRLFYYTSRKNKIFLAGWVNRIAKMIRFLNQL